MDEPVPRSNWDDAIRATLVCRFCAAANRPGVAYVEIIQNGKAYCTVCGREQEPKRAT